MKMMLLGMSFAVASAFAVLPFTGGAVEPLSTAETCEQLATPSASQPMCGRCGDGYCSKSCGETEKNCPQDCGVAY